MTWMVERSAAAHKFPVTRVARAVDAAFHLEFADLGGGIVDVAPTVGFGAATFTRASAATTFDAQGRLVTVGLNKPRSYYDPVTGIYKGHLREATRTNSVRNNSMIGAVNGVIGAGGAIPTNWTSFVIGSAGMTQTVVGTGVEDGIPYVDLQLSGTVGGTGSWTFYFESNTATVAAPAEYWTGSVYTRLVGGALGTLNLAAPLFVNCHNAVGTFLAVGSTITTQSATPTNAPLRSQRNVTVRQLNDAGTLRAGFGWFLNLPNGEVVDFTLRVGMPQLELGIGVSSPITTTTVAVTRSADLLRYNASGNALPSKGSFYAEFNAPESANNLNQFLFQYDDLTYNNRHSLFCGTTGFLSTFSSSGGVGDGLATAVGGVLADGANKAASGWTHVSLSATAKGRTFGHDTAFTPIASALTNIHIGSDHTGANALIGTIREVKLFTERLPDSELQAMVA